MSAVWYCGLVPCAFLLLLFLCFDCICFCPLVWPHNHAHKICSTFSGASQVSARRSEFHSVEATSFPHFPRLVSTPGTHFTLAWFPLSSISSRASLMWHSEPRADLGLTTLDVQYSRFVCTSIWADNHSCLNSEAMFSSPSISLLAVCLVLYLICVAWSSCSHCIPLQKPLCTRCLTVFSQYF